jgi:broad specificity phosphatase PhoE
MDSALLKGMQATTPRDPMSILLIRHGETALNAARIVQHPDTPLNERGMGQARRLAERLAKRIADHPIGAIVASDYRRAHMTAQAIADAIGLPITIQESLRERNFGAVRGTPHADLGVDLYAPDFHPSGGESWPEFHARVTGAWEEVARRAESIKGDLAVVSHALVCRSLLENHLTVEDGMQATVTRWPNTALTIIEHQPPWRVSRLACGAHLDGEVADDSGAKS